MKTGFSLQNLLFFLLLFLAVPSCHQPEGRKVRPAFYHWKTSLDISAFEESYLKSIPIRRIYLRFFDVDWDGISGQPLPLADLEVKTPVADSIEIVPAVFITNRTFLNLPSNKVPGLAENVFKKITHVFSKFPGHQVMELQFDCDWTAKTKEKYFNFLKAIKSKLKDPTVQLSSTIRLHQIKYFERTGVPPVDKGVLMFYNMGDVEDLNTKNSILDLAIAKSYLTNFEKYPLRIDLALPLFSWGVLIREGKMIKLINNLRASDLEDEDRFSKIDESHFEIIKSTYLQGYYLYEGDVLRLEKVSAELLRESAELLNKKVVHPDVTVIFYHLDSIAIKHYTHETLEDICNRFR